MWNTPDISIYAYIYTKAQHSSLVVLMNSQTKSYNGIPSWNSTGTIKKSECTTNGCMRQSVAKKKLSLEQHILLTLQKNVSACFVLGDSIILLLLGSELSPCPPTPVQPVLPSLTLFKPPSMKKHQIRDRSRSAMASAFNRQLYGDAIDG